MYSKFNGIVYVDAGCFVVGDRDWFISKGADPKLMEGMDHQFIVKCNPGRYTIKYTIPGSYDESDDDDDEYHDAIISDTHILNIKSGELWITDACYVMEDDVWGKFLDEDCLDNDDISHFTIHTGGDGEFDLGLEIEG